MIQLFKKLLFAGTFLFLSTSVPVHADDNIGMTTKATDTSGRPSSHAIVSCINENGQIMQHAYPIFDAQEMSYAKQARAQAASQNEKLPVMYEEHNGVMISRPMTPAEIQRRSANRRAADSHIITSYTTEGVNMSFKILSEENKTCQVGLGEGNSAGSDDAAIDHGYSGTVTIPEEVKGYKVISIGNGAFYNCRKLNNIIIPNTIDSIKFCAFSYCESLESLYIPASVDFVNFSISHHTISLEKIVVDAANPTYDSRNDCNAVITTSKNDLIFGCKKTVIPTDVKRIGGIAFGGCEGLTSLFIPANVSYVHGQAFGDCSNLTKIVVDPQNTSLDSRDDCNAIVSSSDNTIITGCFKTTIPESVTGIGFCAFSGHDQLEEITLHKNIQAIGNRAFENCPELKKIVAWMPKPFAIEPNVFYVYAKSNADATLYVPKNTKSAYQSTQGWSQFHNIVEMETGPDNPVVVTDEFTAMTPEGITMKFKIIDETQKTCQVGWYDGGGVIGFDNCSVDNNTTGTITIPSKANGYQVVKIAGAAFFGLSSVTDIVIPSTVTEIENFAFSYTKAMKSLYLPASVTHLSDYALGDMEGRIQITVDANNPVYNSSGNCNGVIETSSGKLVAGCKTTVIPLSVTEIGHAAFYGCNDATSFTIPKTVKAIGTQAFSYCYNLETLEVESGNPVFDSRDQCGAVIKTATNTFFKGGGRSVIPESVTAITANAFEGNNVLEKLEIPAGVTSIEKHATYNCYHLNQVTSLIVKPFAIDKDAIIKSGNIKPEYLYVPAGSKSAYMATEGWNLFTNIVELGSEATIDIDPLPENATTFAEKLSGGENLSNTKVGNVLLTLDPDKGDGFDILEGCVVMNSTMSEEAVENIDLSKVGTQEFANQFTGLVFAISAGSGSISIDLQTLGQHSLGVKIGGGAAVKITHSNREKIVINYNVAEDTYVLIYCTEGASAPSGLRSPSTNSNSIRVYSLEWKRTGDYSETQGISSIADEGNSVQRTFSLDGQQIKSAKRGINIIRQSNGETKKVLVK